MQTMFVHEEEDRYSFFNIDSIFDFLLSIGVRPFVELSFMPEALASGDQTVFNYVNHVSPPDDYDEWGKLIHQLVTHCIDRYGLDEVRRWFFEVWNEPNLDAFWSGDQGYSFWAFTDIFEENFIPSKPFHGGFGMLKRCGFSLKMYTPISTPESPASTKITPTPAAPGKR